jgi:hypothetical protein
VNEISGDTCHHCYYVSIQMLEISQCVSGFLDKALRLSQTDRSCLCLSSKIWQKEGNNSYKGCMGSHNLLPKYYQWITFLVNLCKQILHTWVFENNTNSLKDRLLSKESRTLVRATDAAISNNIVWKMNQQKMANSHNIWGKTVESMCAHHS